MVDERSEEFQRRHEELTLLIDALERRDLDERQEATVVLPSTALEARFLKVLGLARFPSEEKAQYERYMAQDMIAGLYGLKVPLVFLILAEPHHLNLYYGVSSPPSTLGNVDNALNALEAALRSIYPQIDLDRSETRATLTQRIQQSFYFGLMTGIPTPKVGTEELGVEQVERLIRGLYGRAWGYMVLARPVSEVEICNMSDAVVDEIREWYGDVKVSEQRPGERVDQQISVERINRLAQYYIELLEEQLARFKLAKSLGLWQVLTYFFAPSLSTFCPLRSLLKAVFGGETSSPQPIRTFEFPASARAQEVVSHFLPLDNPLPRGSGIPLEEIIRYRYLTSLHSQELATLVDLPQQEMPGYDVSHSARFAVCVPPRILLNSVPIGNILDQGVETPNSFQIEVEDLSRHGLVVGVTGSGKTNTCMHLLEQIWKMGVPFLVIEPAKREYRALHEVDLFRDHLRVFTLGDETTAPFRRNPFEMEHGAQVQTHLDNLKAVFNASISLWAPLPTVLERCLHEVYVDRGWNLARNCNEWVAEGSGTVDPDLFPTLTDLYHKVDEVTDRLGYEARVTMDVKAALKTRIDSLRIGGKGLMLDTRRSVPIKVLLERPTVLELESIGDDDEKAFVIGLLLMSIYEYLRANAKSLKEQGWKHVILIEEAHRLLQNVPMETANLEAANVKGKAVETFCNILSEIRAYGEGVLIAEQIPVKLAPDAIKNTNLKLMHRMVAQEDRDVMGDSMNLTEEQKRFVAALDRGRAVIYAEGTDEPFLVKIDHYPGKDSLTENGRVRRFMNELFYRAQGDVLTQFKGCAHCLHPCEYRGDVRSSGEGDVLATYLSRYLLTMIAHVDWSRYRYPDLARALVGRERMRRGGAAAEGLLWCALLHASACFFEAKRRQYSWSYADMATLQEEFLSTLHGLMGEITPTGEAKVQEISIDTAEPLRRFAEDYRRAACVEADLMEGCPRCEEQCLYRSEAAAVLADPRFTYELKKAFASDEQEILPQAIAASQRAARCLFLDPPSSALKYAAFCCFIQKIPELGYTRIEAMADAFLHSYP